MSINIVSVISDGILFAGLLGSAVGLGRKIGWYERKIKDMGGTISGISKDVERLDDAREETIRSAASFTAKYEEKIDNIASTLKEVKEMIYKHVTNGGNK